jgi:dipeptidyl-peptidase-4
MLGLAMLTFTAAQLGAQIPTGTRVTIDRLFTTPDFQQDELGAVQWFPGNPGAYTILEPSAGNTARGTDIVRYDAATGAREVLAPAAKLTPAGTSEPIDIENYTWSPDGNRVLLFTNSRRVWRENTRGDYWLYDRTTGALKQMGAGSPPSTLMFAKFSPDSRRVAYVRQNNLYVEDVATGHITPLTTDGSTTLINGTFDWVYEEELNLRDGFRWSPDGTQIAYWQLNAAGVGDFDVVDDTDSLYSFVKPVQYPKAGTTNSAARVGVVSAGGGATRWLDVPGDPRNSYIARMDWAANSNQIALQHLNRAQNTLELLLGDARTGSVQTIVTERDSAWVDVNDDAYWLHAGSQFLWVSERDGWRHTYVVSRDGRTTKLLTPGSFDVTDPGFPFGATFIKAIDSTRGVFYYLASPENATQLYLYRSRLDGSGRPERVTPAGQAGVHRYRISPDGRWAIHTWSTFDTPPTTEVVRLPEHTVVRTLITNERLKATLNAVARRPTEFTKLDGAAGGEPGTDFDAWIIKPPAFDSTKRYPVLYTVYGGPGQVTVLDEWDSFTYLLHLMFAQQGYVVASVDNRGTPAPKGRAWRKAIYKQIGVVDTKDLTAAALALNRRSYADATRVGVWGWSNGGTVTLNLLLRSPGVYAMGMAVSPVTDQRFYDTIYTERYMGLPQDNEDAYRQAAPMTYADSLRGKLLIVHGSGDDNVHYQNTETFINALIAANKPFTMMDYPNRTHCICEGRNTSRHLLELLQRYLTENLPPGPR